MNCIESLKALGAACSLYQSSGWWRLALEGKELFYIAGSETGSAPPLTHWMLKNGSAPAPTLVEGPVPH
jgi:hypothetical protein